jgi:hypothetical protein
MKAEHWLQILVGVVILGTLGFLSTNVYDMRGLLSGMTEKMEQTERRVTRIADVLPDVRAKVAWEEVQAPLSGFLAVSTPVEQHPDEWTSTIHLYHARTGALQAFQITRSEQEKDLPRYLVAGRIRTEGFLDPTFHELVGFANSEQIAMTLPANLDSQASFVIRSHNMETFEEFLREVSDGEPETKEIPRLRNWLEVARELKGLDGSE